MSDDAADMKRLMELYRVRMKDRRQAKTRRRRALESGPERISGILSTYFGNDPQASHRMDEARAIMAWPAYVGDSAARMSRVLRVRNGQLVVAVADPLWMSQLSFLKHDLIRKYRSDFKNLQIKDIFFTRE